MVNTLQLVVKDACAWPNLFQVDEHTVGAVIFNRPSHGLEEGSLELWLMDKQTGAWSFRSTPAPCEPGRNRMHSGCGVAPDGTLHVLSTGFSVAEGKFVRFERMWHSSSKDRGKTWEINKNLVYTGLEPLFIPHGSILFLADTTMLAAVYRSLGKGRPSHTWCITSSDQGNSWKLHSQIGSGDTNEAHLLLLGGSLQACVRTHVDHHVRFYSHGKTIGWKDGGHLTLPMQHPGHLLLLGGDLLLCTYGIRNKGLMALGGRFSADRGETWLPPFILHQFPEEATDCGYPSSLRMKNDEIITGCYTDRSAEYDGYQFGVVRWKISDYLPDRQLRSISDGRKLRV